MPTSVSRPARDGPACPAPTMIASKALVMAVPPRLLRAWMLRHPARSGHENKELGNLLEYRVNTRFSHRSGQHDIIAAFHGVSVMLVQRLGIVFVIFVAFALSFGSIVNHAKSSRVDGDFQADLIHRQTERETLNARFLAFLRLVETVEQVMQAIRNVFGGGIGLALFIAGGILSITIADDLSPCAGARARFLLPSPFQLISKARNSLFTATRLPHTHSGRNAA